MNDLSATLQERGSRYGAFADNALIAQNLKGIIRQYTGGFQADQKEALEMIAHKIGRILAGDPNYADSWIDIAGYAKLVADRLEAQP